MSQATPGGVREALSRLRRHSIARLGAIAIVLLFVVAIFADLLAAELPVVMRHQGRWWFMANVTHPVELADHDCASLAAEDPGGLRIGPLVCHGPAREHEGARLAPPMARAGHPLGTDAHFAWHYDFLQFFGTPETDCAPDQLDCRTALASGAAAAAGMPAGKSAGASKRKPRAPRRGSLQGRT